MSQIFSAFGQSQVNKYNQKMEKYRNDMRAIQSGHSQNSATVQEIYTQADTKRQHLANELNYLASSGATEVQVAMSGFSGRTSDAVAKSHQRAKMLNTAAIEESLDRSRLASATKRMNIAFGLEMSLEDGWVQPVDWIGAAAGDAATVYQASGGGAGSGKPAKGKG